MSRARIFALALLATATLAGGATGPAPAIAQQWTEAQRRACEDDAMRLCGAYVPDVQRITACMQQYRRYLSPRCRAMFGRRR
jgi:hypothetical protein